MPEEPSQFNPSPSRKSKRKPRKRQVVGAGTPSKSCRRSTSRTETASREGTTTHRRAKTRARKRNNPFRRVMYLGLLLVAGVGIFLVWNLRLVPGFGPESASVASTSGTSPPDRTPDSTGAAAPTSAPFLPFIALPQFPTSEPTRPPTPVIPEIAIVAGHWAKEATDGIPTVRDSGAVCPDGLREVDITKNVADKTLALLERRGYHGVLLEEFDPRYVQTPKFKPRVFLSVHADSCLVGGAYVYASGYKIAHAEPSKNKEQDARLVTCLIRSYDTIAYNHNLPFNANTITPNMTEYHAFRKIDPTTPAAIIELGFLGYDREFLVNNQDDIARALTIGLEDFLKGQTCLPPTATPKPTETTLP